jgi:tetratricopeptide (TPR) repeat protein
MAAAKEAIAQASAFREEGKALFQAGKYKEALAEYHKIYMYVHGFSLKGTGSADLMASLRGGGSSEQQVSEDDMMQLRELKFVHFTNVGLCHLKLGNAPKCITYCTKVRALRSDLRCARARGRGCWNFDHLLTRRLLPPRAGAHLPFSFALSPARRVQALELAPDNVKCLFRRGKCSLDVGDLDAARDDLTRVRELDSTNREVVHELKRLKAMSAAQDRKASKKFSKMFAQMSSEDGGAPAAGADLEPEGWHGPEATPPEMPRRPWR